MFPSPFNGLTKVGLNADLRPCKSRPLDLIWNLRAGQQPEPRPLKGWTDDTQLETESSQPYPVPKLQIRESQGRGLGLFTTEHIPAYTKVLEDDPLLSLAKGEDLPELWQKYCLLSVDLKAQFGDLSYGGSQSAREETLISKLRKRGYKDGEATQMARVSSRFQANAFNNGSSSTNQTWAHSLFLTVARINHSCAPNAHSHYRSSSGARLIYALREIQPGEEIEISYFNMTMPFSDRQERAKVWGFVCTCPICVEGRKFQNSAYEKILASMRSGMTIPSSLRDTTLSLADWINNSEQAINIARSSQYSWLVAVLPNLYYCLGRLLQLGHGPFEEIKEAYKNALKWEGLLTGPESPSSNERRQHLRDLIEEDEL